MKNSFTIVLSLFISLFGFPQTDMERGKDNSPLPEYPGSAVVYYDEVENGFYKYTLGPLTRTSEEQPYKLTDIKNLEGKVLRIQYLVKNETDILKVVNFYEYALKQNGFEITAYTQAGKPMETAGRNWILAAFDDLPDKEKANISGTKGGTENRYYLAAHLIKQDREVYAALVINEFDTNEIYIHSDIIGHETKPDKIALTDAAAIEEGINEHGRIVIGGIYFDTGKAEIKTGSDPALDEIAKYLKSNGVVVYVVGHTGMTGNLDFLLVLSKSRADAIIKALTTRYYINPARLIARGLGPLSPLTTNQTPEGREENQRIELVLKNF